MMMVVGDDDDGCGGRECGFALTMLMMVTVVRCPLIGSWFMCGVYVLLLVSRELHLHSNLINSAVPSTIGHLTGLLYVHTTL